MELLYVIAYLWLFWGMYVLVMGLYRAHLDKRLNWFTYTLSAPFLVIGYAMDCFANIFIASFVFAEPPKELLVTTRLQRYMGYSVGWRKQLAEYVCEHLLDVFDPTGDHC